MSETNKSGDGLAEAGEREAVQEQIVAEELGVEPEVIQLPPNVRIGVTVFELSNGEYGFMPTNNATTLMDVYGLLARIQAGIEADLVSQRIMRAQREVAANAAKAQQQKAKIIVPQLAPRGK